MVTNNKAPHGTSSYGSWPRASLSTQTWSTNRNKVVQQVKDVLSKQQNQENASLWVHMCYEWDLKETFIHDMRDVCTIYQFKNQLLPPWIISWCLLLLRHGLWTGVFTCPALEVWIFVKISQILPLQHHQDSQFIKEAFTWEGSEKVPCKRAINPPILTPLITSPKKSKRKERSVNLDDDAAANSDCCLSWATNQSMQKRKTKRRKERMELEAITLTLTTPPFHEDKSKVI